MVQENHAIEKMVLTRLLKLNATILSLTVGLFAGSGICFITNYLLIKGGENIGPHLALLGQFFIGYEVSFFGSIIGFLYAFAAGFVITFVFASLYNWLSSIWPEKR